jgi:hypothetical protein
MKLRAGAAFFLMILMVLFGVVYGAYHGWNEERIQVEETWAGLESMIQARVESAYNVLTVARRHLPEGHEALLRLQKAKDTLEGNAPLSEKAAANEELTLAAKDVLLLLVQAESVQKDSRDKMYAESYLPQMLSQSEEKTAGAQYNIAAAQFNERLSASFSGKIASLLGVKMAEEFIAP